MGHLIWGSLIQKWSFLLWFSHTHSRFSLYSTYGIVFPLIFWWDSQNWSASLYPCSHRHIFHLRIIESIAVFLLILPNFLVDFDWPSHGKWFQTFIKQPLIGIIMVLDEFCPGGWTGTSQQFNSGQSVRLQTGAASPIIITPVTQEEAKLMSV